MILAFTRSSFNSLLKVTTRTTSTAIASSQQIYRNMSSQQSIDEKFQLPKRYQGQGPSVWWVHVQLSRYHFNTFISLLLLSSVWFKCIILSKFFLIRIGQEWVHSVIHEVSAFESWTRLRRLSRSTVHHRCSGCHRKQPELFAKPIHKRIRKLSWSLSDCFFFQFVCSIFSWNLHFKWKYFVWTSAYHVWICFNHFQVDKILLPFN